MEEWDWDRAHWGGIKWHLCCGSRDCLPRCLVGKINNQKW